ncbi:MAG: serine hydrolase [Elusimicrobiota bacterium]
MSDARSRSGRKRTSPVILIGAAAVIFSLALGYKLDWSQRSSLAAATEAGSFAAEPISTIAPAPPTRGADSIVTPEKWARMTDDLRLMAKRSPAPVAIYLKDFKTGMTWTYHPDMVFPAASLIKLPLMAAVFYKIKEGGLSLDQKLVLRRRNRVGGSGTLKWRPDGSSFSIHDLLIHLISESDNTAANMLLEAVGVHYAQKKFSAMGLVYTCIHRQGMSLRSGYVPHDNYTTAREMSMLLTKIYRGKLIDPVSSRMMLDILRYPKPEATRLAIGLPRGWVIAHKTGLERRACHDAAIFFTPYGDYVMTVLTGKNRSYHWAKNFIMRLGHVTFAFYGGRVMRRHRYYARVWRRRRGRARSVIR